MKFTREELSLIQSSLCYYNKSFPHRNSRTAELSKEVAGRIQVKLLADEAPITMRSPMSVM